MSFGELPIRYLHEIAVARMAGDGHALLAALRKAESYLVSVLKVNRAAVEAELASVRMEILTLVGPLPTAESMRRSASTLSADLANAFVRTGAFAAKPKRPWWRRRRAA